MRTPLLTLLFATTLIGCASTRTVRMHIETPAGGPMIGALINAAPLGISISPLPITTDNIHEAKTQKGTGGVTDRTGTIRLTLETEFAYEIRVQPSPLSDDARDRKSVV